MTVILAISELSLVGIITSSIAALSGIVAAWLTNRGRRSNHKEHGEVIEMLARVEAGQRHLEDRVTDVGRSVGQVREQLVRHLEHHLSGTKE